MGVSPTPNFWRQRRVLLTGHTGFKGSWLCLWLQQLGASLHGLGLPPERQTSTTPALFETLDLANSLGPEHHHLLDIRNAEAVVELVRRAQPEIVFHLAAQPLVRLSYQQPEQTWSTNVQGTLHLLQALRQLNHPCAVVLISTDKVYANQNWDPTAKPTTLAATTPTAPARQPWSCWQQAGAAASVARNRTRRRT